MCVCNSEEDRFAYLSVYLSARGLCCIVHHSWYPQDLQHNNNLGQSSRHKPPIERRMGVEHMNTIMKIIPPKAPTFTVFPFNNSNNTVMPEQVSLLPSWERSAMPAALSLFWGEDGRPWLVT